MYFVIFLCELKFILLLYSERIRAHVKGASWTYERLTFPRVKDQGLASVILGGYGARVGLKMRISRQGTGNVLRVLDSYCVIDRLDVELYECRHRFLYKVLHHKIVKGVKNAVEQSVADKLGQCVALVDQKLVSCLAEYVIPLVVTFRPNSSLGRRKNKYLLVVA